MRTSIAPLFICAAAALATMLTSPRAWSAPPSFQGLGHLPGYIYTRPRGVSNDGSVVVGYSRSSDFSKVEAFLWNGAEGIQPLGFMPGSSYTYAAGISGDGSTIVGGRSSPGDAQAFRWTSAEGMQSLGFPPGNFFSEAINKDFGIAISADGTTIVGASDGNAFRWTSAGGLQRLRFPVGVKSSSVNAVSADGSVFVGSFSSGINGAFRWTNDGGFQDLGVEAVDFNPSAFAVSADGSVVVGFNGGYAFRWTAEGTEILGDPRFNSVAMGVSGDGSILVGYSDDGAFIWDATRGMRNIQQVLVNDYGLNLTGWTLQSATGISADGSTIVGYGTGPAGQSAWIATIPEPTSLVLLSLGGIFVFILRRRQRSGEGRSDQVV